MNKKDLERLFVKYSDVIESRYQKLTTPKVDYITLKENKRDNFEKVLQK